MDIKIFVSHRIDRDSEIINNPIFIPVRCGAIFDERDNIKMLGDNLGENISERRMTFNELTVQYWAWKNIKSDYYGLCHYRRYMIFSPEELQADPYGNVLFENLDYDSSIKCGLLSTKQIKKMVYKNDLLISVPYDVTYRGFHNLYEHYTEVPMQHRKDMEIALETIRDVTPEYFESANEYFNGVLFYPCNLFIMKKEIFSNYCQWLFKILFELENRIDISNYDEAEQRVFGLIGERLLGVFFIHYVKQHPQCRYQLIQRALFWHTERNFDCKNTLDTRIKCTIKNRFNETGILYQTIKKLYHIFNGGKKP